MTRIIIEMDGIEKPQIIQEGKEILENKDSPKTGVAMPAVEISETAAERYSLVSELADVCEYLDESEVIKIRLIIANCNRRAYEEGT